MKFYLTSVRKAIIKKSTNNKCWRGFEKKETSSNTIGGNVNWYRQYGDKFEVSLRKKTAIKIEVLYDPAIPLLGIYSEETIISKDTHTPAFKAVVFTIAKTWKQPNVH